MRVQGSIQDAQVASQRAVQPLISIPACANSSPRTGCLTGTKSL